MTDNWPQLPQTVAIREYGLLSSRKTAPASASRHPAQIYAPVGGRVRDVAIAALIEEVTGLAGAHGFPGAAGDSARIAFDRAAAPLLRARMDLSWAEAGNRGTWSFLSLTALPDVTWWRFGIGNQERWIATDLTRHTWARLWWQAVVFENDGALLNALSESDLNQLLERRSIGGDPRLVRALAGAVVGAPSQVPRRYLIRETTLRLRRLLAFVDVRALESSQVDQMCRELTEQTIGNLSSSTSHGIAP